MNMQDIMIIVVLVMTVALITIVMFAMHDYINSVDEKVDDLKDDYVLNKNTIDINESRKVHAKYLCRSKQSGTLHDVPNHNL